MKTWQEVKESPNYRRLKDSLELRCAGKNLLIYGIMTVLLGAVSMLSLESASVRSAASAVVVLVMTLMVMVPFTLFYLYRVFKIFHHIDAYAFTEVVLDTPRSGMGRYSMYFEVKVRDRFGAEIATQTHEIFSTHIGGSSSLEEYINKKVLIGYNHVTGFVAVIG